MAKKLQMCGTEEEMREVAGKICKNYLHGAWKTVDSKEIQFSRVCGGLSNFLYYVALPEDKMDSHGRIRRTTEGDEPRKVLLRIYGQVHGERAVDAIVTESVIFTLLSERKLGPRLWGVFSGGRIEEYIPSRQLTTQELSEPAFSMKIAEKMALIHTMDIPLSKEPQWLWKSMTKWLKDAKADQTDYSAMEKKGKELESIARLRGVDLESEIEWLRKFLAAVDSPVVFCHNDMQEGNILLPDESESHSTHECEEEGSTVANPKETHGNAPSIEYNDQDAGFINPHYEENTNDTILSSMSDNGEPKLYIIDFEYCAYNHRGFDIANHFQEWMYDYTNKEYPFFYEKFENRPTLEQKEIFIKEYLKHYAANSTDGRNAEATIDAVNSLLNEVEAFALASHLFWCLWSMVNASKSKIPFGYWEYAVSRFDVYLQLKQEIIKNDRNCVKRKIEEVDI